MKKSLLIFVCLFLSLSSSAFSMESQGSTTQSDVHQKACQNVFSLINLDLSFMSPRAAVSDVSVSDQKALDNKKGATVAISNKKEAAQTPEPPKNRTSLFRIDLLHMFKIQIL